MHTLHQDIEDINQRFQKYQFRQQCQLIQNSLTQARDLLSLIVRGQGLNPLWNDAIAAIDFTKPIGCSYSDCELSILTAVGGENLVA